MPALDGEDCGLMSPAGLAKRELGASPFGLLLLRHRLAAGLSQEALAERAKMSVEGISALERGTRRSPRFDTVALLVSALALEPDGRRTFEAAARPSLPRARDLSLSTTVLGGQTSGERASNNLPVALSSFIGRTAEVEAIAALVREHRLVTITGSGGIGKTRVALQTASAALDHLADGGIWLAEFAPLNDSSLVAATVAAALGVRAVPDFPVLATLLAFLRQKTLLLILDNCEHVINAAAALIDALLRGCPGLRVLATCREPLRVEGEHVYRLPSLSAPADAAQQLAATSALGYASIALFTERANAVDPHFTLTDENAPAVADICRRLDGIPLAIELAAARINILPVRTLAERLDQRFALFTIGNRNALPRQQTLRALIDWSYALLDERERRCLAALSVCVGRFSIEAATQVCAENGEAPWTVFEIVAGLTAKSLLLVEADGETLRQLETTRLYAAEKLQATGSANEPARRHLDYYLSLAQSAAASFGTTSGRAWRSAVGNALDNVRAALRWSLDERHDVAGGIALTAWFYEAWMALGLDFECQERIEAALERCDDTTLLALHARLLLARGQLGIRSQRSAIVPAEAAVDLYRLTDDERGLATALNVLGYALSREDRCDLADELYAEALLVATRIGDTRQRGLALLNLGVNRETANDFTRTRELYEAALELGIAHGDDYLVGAGNLDLSVLCEAIDAPDDGFAYARRAFEAFERAGDANGSALALGNITTNLIGLGRMAEARVAARDYVTYAVTHRLDTIFIIALEKVAAIAHAAGEFAASAELLGFTAGRAVSLGLKRDPGNVRFTDAVLQQLRAKIGNDLELSLKRGASLTEAAAADVALAVVSPANDSVESPAS